MSKPTYNNFSYTERTLGFETDNLINYNAGPIQITISCWSEEITIKTDQQWEYLLKEFMETATLAWELEPTDIKNNNNPITIKLNYKILKLYVEHSIVFW